MNVRALVPTSTARAYAPYFATAAAIFLTAAVLGSAARIGGGSSGFLVVRDGEFDASHLEFSSLFLHNARIALVAAFGFLLFGLPTVYLLTYNGFTVGSVLVTAVETAGPVRAFAGLAPRAVFELPAIWLGSAICFRFVYVVWLVVQGKRLSRPPHVYAWQTTVAIATTLGLLAAAAWVEATVTPVAVRYVAGAAGVLVGG